MREREEKKGLKKSKRVRRGNCKLVQSTSHVLAPAIPRHWIRLIDLTHTHTHKMSWEEGGRGGGTGKEERERERDPCPSPGSLVPQKKRGKMVSQKKSVQKMYYMYMWPWASPPPPPNPPPLSLSFFACFRCALPPMLTNLVSSTHTHTQQSSQALPRHDPRAERQDRLEPHPPPQPPMRALLTHAHGKIGAKSRPGVLWSWPVNCRCGGFSRAPGLWRLFGGLVSTRGRGEVCEIHGVCVVWCALGTLN